jgi:hypothetical protein
MKTSAFVTAFMAGLLLSTATPLCAFDLTGNWIGKWSCKGFDGAKFKSANPTSTLAITQVGDTIAASLDNGDFLYNGRAITDVVKPEKGEVVLAQCGTDNLPAAGPEGEIVRAAVKTKPDTFKASFKALSIFDDDFPGVGTCKYSFKRQDQTEPGIAPCP